MAALAAPGTTPQAPLTWMVAPRTWTSEDLKGFLQHGLPQGKEGQCRVGERDHASIHRARVIQDAPPELDGTASSSGCGRPTVQN